MNAHTFRLEPFDIMIHATAEGTQTLQRRFANWLRGLSDPARFWCWQVPADLSSKIGEISSALREADPARQDLLVAYRRSYEALQSAANYQRTLCGMALWSDEHPHALAGSMASAFDTHVSPAAVPPLFVGDYALQQRPFWHLAPLGRPGGRPVWAVLSSYEFLPATWNFFQPLPPVLKLNIPVAMALDLPKTYDRNSATDKVESIILAYETHLATNRGEDSRSVRRIEDCRRTLQDINDGDALHEMRLVVAVAAYDTRTLQERVQLIRNSLRPWLGLRVEMGELLSRSVGIFAPIPTAQLHLPEGTWPVTSSEAALALSPLGYRKLSHTAGVMRGEAVGAAYPVFHQSWREEKHASHEVWVGVTGYGKTFYLNCYLAREYAEQGVPFDLLEPMGHGQLMCAAFDLEWHSLSQASRLNPQDIMFPTLLEQVSHTIRIYETVMGRQLSGTQQANLERGLLAQALEVLYTPWLDDLESLRPQDTPLAEDLCTVLRGLGQQGHIQRLARQLADEIGALCTGSGPWARFLNGHTTVSFGRGADMPPRVFSFHELESDPIMVALAYTQVLSAIRRDSLRDDKPRIIAVDEVYRLMRHPALLDFLIEAAKTFRTRRKKLISIDQNMSVFLQGKARLVFENSPIRVIFNQRQGMHVFREDPAFQHMNERHLELIATLPRYHFLLDIQDEGIWCLKNLAMDAELQRFATS